MTSLTQPAVTASIDFINSVRIKCEQGGLSQVKAYALAFDIENSLIEKRFFSVFALEKPEVLEIMVL
jgi:predicted metallopeptidase